MDAGSFNQKPEEQRYCPTCQKKTLHWVTRKKIPQELLENLEDASQEGEITKTECRVCGTVENR